MPRSTTDDTLLNIPTDDLMMRADAATGAVEYYDRLRSRWVKATPEERVRQCFVSYLARGLGYMPSRMVNEYGLRLNGTLRRVDTVVYDDYMRPLMLVEYKAPSVTLTRRAFEQVMRYNLVMGARYLTVTNGIHIYCCEVTGAGQYEFIDKLPHYDDVRGSC